ncbi:MAG: DMT family transporter [Planctomycetota bacterium]
MFVIPVAFLGHAAGLATSVLWTGTSLFFTAAGRRLGPTTVNALRILMAILLLGLTHWVTEDRWIPDALPRQVLFLALSGMIGLALGDQALFTAFVYIGPRLSMLIMTTAPLFAALFGWLRLGEELGPSAWLGIALVVGGVAWVVLERPVQNHGVVNSLRIRGIVLAFIAAACQAGGLLLSKEGLGHGWLPEGEHMNPQAATLLRMSFAGVGMVPIIAWRLWRERRAHAIGEYRQPRRSWRIGLLLTAGGAVFGPFLGVWMSLEAADKVPLGVAQTLCSLPPVLILPVARLVYHEHISARAVAGALLAVGGVALLFLPT